MPFTRPTLAELVDRIRGDLSGELEIDGPLLRRAMVKVLAAAWGGTAHGLYGFLDWIKDQMFSDTSEEAQLLREAKLYGITPVPATFASGNLTATGVNGSVIPINTILKLDTTRSYRVTAGQVIAGGTATLPVVALLAGASSNLVAGTAVAFESPIAGVNANATVAADITNGVDQEGVEEVRARLNLRKREPPTGGSDQDYIGWALAVAGVTRAWVYRNELGLGTVVVRFVLDGDAISIFPDAGDVTAVQAKLDAERPITDAPTAMAPVDHPVAFTIALTPNNADTQAAVAAELADLLTRVAEPGDGVARGKLKLSAIRTAIGVAEGVEDYVLTVPAADVVPGVGELLTFGTPTWL